jgi:DNA-binding CsgD family transcriptional regulator
LRDDRSTGSRRCGPGQRHRAGARDRGPLACAAQRRRRRRRRESLSRGDRSARTLTRPSRRSSCPPSLRRVAAPRAKAPGHPGAAAHPRSRCSMRWGSRGSPPPRARAVGARRARPQPTVETRDDLTAQERQIARLACDGLSIGARLFIRQHTVADHVRKVFAKLGITSGNQLSRALPAKLAAHHRYRVDLADVRPAGRAPV